MTANRKEPHYFLFADHPLRIVEASFPNMSNDRNVTAKLSPYIDLPHLWP
jgi:hypothetical protein